MSLPISIPSRTPISAWDYLDYPLAGTSDLDLPRSALDTSSSDVSSSIFISSTIFVSTMGTTSSTTSTTSDPTTPSSSDIGNPISTTSSGDKIPAGAFLGGLVGGIAALVLIFGLLVCILMKRKERNNVNNKDNNSSGSRDWATTNLYAEVPREDLDATSPSPLQVPAQDTRTTQPSAYVPQVNNPFSQSQEKCHFQQSPETYIISSGHQCEPNKQRPFTSIGFLTPPGTQFGPRTSRSFQKQGSPSTSSNRSSIDFLAQASTHFGPRARLSSTQQPESSFTPLPHVSAADPAHDGTSTQCRPVSNTLQPVRPQTITRPFQPLRASHATGIAEL